MMQKRYYFHTIAIAFLLFFFGCKEKSESVGYKHTQARIFNTEANFKYDYNRSLEKEITARLDSFDRSLNPFNENSIIYKVNNNLPVELDDWFLTVYAKAQAVSRLTSGYYDITAAPLINLWGFGYEEMNEPSVALVDSLKQFVGYNKIRLEGRTLLKDDPQIQINASSLAKGYAVDLITELFDSYEIANYMVEIGGEVRAKGVNPNNDPWKIGISRPIDDNTGLINEIQEVVEVNNRAIATSGNSRNYYIKDGQKYAHTINPLTGYPAETDLLSATVFYPDCITADAFATAFMVMGRAKASELADKIQNLDYLFIYLDDKGRLATSTNQPKE